MNVWGSFTRCCSVRNEYQLFMCIRMMIAMIQCWHTRTLNNRSICTFIYLYDYIFIIYVIYQFLRWKWIDSICPGMTSKLKKMRICVWKPYEKNDAKCDKLFLFILLSDIRGYECKHAWFSFFTYCSTVWAGSVYSDLRMQEWNPILTARLFPSINAVLNLRLLCLNY